MGDGLTREELEDVVRRLLELIDYREETIGQLRADLHSASEEINGYELASMMRPGKPVEVEEE